MKLRSNVMRRTECEKKKTERLDIECGDITALVWDSVMKCGVFCSTYVSTLHLQMDRVKL